MADYDYAPPSRSIVLNTVFAAASASACSSAACTTKFPVACRAQNYINASYSTWAAVLSARVPPPTIKPAASQMCMVYSYPCPCTIPDPANASATVTIPCSWGMPGPAVITSYGYLYTSTTQARCDSIAQAYSQIAIALQFCNTPNCNAPSSAAVAASSFFSAAVALVTVAVLW